MTRVKICGLMEEEDVALCVDAGADALGFVVEYPVPVPWDLSRARAAELMALVPPFVARVAVVAGDAPTILGIARDTGAGLVQLHGDEPPAVVAEVHAGLRGTGCRILKALRIPPGETDIGPWLAAGDRFMAAGAAAILVDARGEERPGGTGLAVDIGLAAALREAARWPVILAGGLTPETVAAAIEAVQPYGVDVLTGVGGPGHRKVPELVRAFIAAAR